MSTFNLRLPDDLKSQALARSSAFGVSLNAFIVEAVRHALIDQQKVLDAVAAFAEKIAQAEQELAELEAAEDGDDALMGNVHDLGDWSDNFLNCPRRFKPSGLIGADFLIERERGKAALVSESNKAWFKGHDKRLAEAGMGGDP